VGGASVADRNAITFNTLSGIIVVADAASVRIQHNSMYSNGTIGIDLATLSDPTDPFSAATYGITINDAGDADTGANGLQNFPEATVATLDASTVAITYSVPCVALPLTIEFFIADNSAIKQDKTYLGSGTYSAAGAATVVLPAGALSAGDAIVGTATDDNGNTSEFSAPINVVVLSAGADTGSDTIDGATGMAGVNVLANDTGSAFTRSAIGGCSAFPCTLNVLNSASTVIGSVVVQTSGNYVYTAPAAGTSVAITYTAANASAQTVSSTLTLTSIAPGAPTTINDSATVVASSPFTQTLSILSNDSGNGITLTSVTGNGAPCSAFPCAISTAHGNAIVQASGTYSYTSVAGYPGSDSFTYVITDVAAQTANGIVNLQIVAAPNAQAAAPVPATTLSLLAATAMLLALFGGGAGMSHRKRACRFASRQLRFALISIHGNFDCRELRFKRTSTRVGMELNSTQNPRFLASAFQ
jgi:hypothetical protein